MGHVFSVTLTAYFDGDGQAAILDANGTKIAIVRQELCREACESVVSKLSMRIERSVYVSAVDIGKEERSWRFWSASQTSRAATCAKRFVALKGDERLWQEKCHMWASCHNKRFAFVESEINRARKNKRFFQAWRRSSWDEACQCMRYQAKNRRQVYLQRVADPWRGWSNTVAGNHNRKERMRKRHGKCQAIEAACGRPEVQVCFEWCGADTETGQP